MLKIYLSSVIIYTILLTTTEKVAKAFIKGRDVDYKKYIKGKSKIKINYITIAFIPILRFLMFVIMLFLAFADEKMLDKIFEDKEQKE